MSICSSDQQLYFFWSFPHIPHRDFSHSAALWVKPLWRCCFGERFCVCAGCFCLRQNWGCDGYIFPYCSSSLLHWAHCLSWWIAALLFSSWCNPRHAQSCLSVSQRSAKLPWFTPPSETFCYTAQKLGISHPWGHHGMEQAQQNLEHL